MKTRPGKIAGLLATLLLIAGLAQPDIARLCAQPPEQPTPPRGLPAAAEQEAEGGVRAARTELIYLRDAEGNLVPVANLSLEEWDQIYKAQRNLLGRKVPPPVAIEQVVYDGVAVQGHVQLEVQLQVRVVQQPAQGEWVSLPLGFQQAVLHKAPQHTGSGDFFVTLNKDKEGHVCWLKAEPGTRHTLTLNLIVPTQQAGSQSIITLNCPQARSQVKRLAVPLVDAVPFSDQLRITARPDGSTGTLFNFDFAGGQLVLAWGKTDMAARKPVTRLQASSVTRFTIKGPEQISMQSDISVNSVVGEISSFVIALPPGMQVLDLPQGDIRLNVLPLPEGADASSQRVQITSSQPVNQLQLTIEAVYRPTVPDEAGSEGEQPLDDLPARSLLRGVEIVDAVRQSGFIDFIVDGSWSLSWLQDGDLRRIDEIPDSLLQQQGLARFEFFSPAYLLETGIQPEKTRLRIEPHYLLQVQKDELQLDATLVCQVRGKRGFVLQVNLAGWTIDQVISRPAELVDQENIRFAPDGRLQVPVLASGSGDSQEVEIEIRAFRSLAAADAGQARQLSVVVPRPTTDPLATATVVSRAPGLLVVSPGDNIELVPQVDDIKGLVAGATLTEEQQRLLPRRQQRPLVYRDRGDVTSAEFVGLMRVRQRAATIDSLARVTIDEEQYQVQQELQYSVAYEPVQQVWLDIPANLLVRRSLQVLLLPELEVASAADAVAAEPQVLPWTEEVDQVSRDPDVRRIIRVDLLQDRIGRFQLLLRYSGQQPTLQVDQTVTVPIGLVVPQPDPTSLFQQNRVVLIVDGLVQAVPREEQWQRDEAALANLPESSNPVYRASERTDSMPLVVTLGQPGATVSTQLHQLWLQTYLTSSVRYERAVIRLTTGDRRVQIQLPQLARDNPANLRAAVNQQPLNAEDLIVNDQGILEISLAAGEQRSQLVELWYWSDPATVLPAMEIQPPGVVGVSSVDRMFWQLITPASQHLLSGPDSMTPEQRWTWNRWHWQRQANMQQSDLEQWIGATVQESMPSGTNQYLFTSIGPVGSFTVKTVRRSLLVLVVSGMTLLVGVLLIYLPIVRHPLALLTTTIVLAAAAVNWPEVVLLIAQAALLGGSLVLLARLLEWGVFWRAGGAPRLLGRATIRPENAVDARDLQLDIGDHGSTASVSMPVDAPAVERPV